MAIAGGLGYLALLIFVCAWPWLRDRSPRAPVPAEKVAVTLPPEVPALQPTSYSRILVPLDHSEADHEAIGNALAIARVHGARIILLHIEEGVTSQMFGALASTAEITEGQDYLAGLAATLREQNVGVDIVVRHGNSPAHEIAAAAHDLSPDLVVMASHGHSGIKDLIFGTTINSVRHHLKAPLLIVTKNIKSE